MTGLDTSVSVGSRDRFDSRGWRSVVAMGAVIVALFAVGSILLAAALPGQYALRCSR